MLFVNYVVLIYETRGDYTLELWIKALVSKGFKLIRTKPQCMRCDLVIEDKEVKN